MSIPWACTSAKKPLDATISIDLVDAPLKRNLDAAMSQLGLKYAVRDGLLVIAVREEEELSIYFDPYLVVGASLLALIAMALGSVLGPLVSHCQRARRDSARLQIRPAPETNQ